jgi:hypothetical protein
MMGDEQTKPGSVFLLYVEHGNNRRFPMSYVDSVWFDLEAAEGRVKYLTSTDVKLWIPPTAVGEVFLFRIEKMYTETGVNPVAMVKFYDLNGAPYRGVVA